MAKNSTVNFALYGQIIKVDGDKKVFKPYGEQKSLTVKVKDNLKVGDSVRLTLYESPNFNLMKVSLVKFSKIPVFLKSYSKTAEGLEVVLVSKDQSLNITRTIAKNDPLFASLKDKRMIMAAVFDDIVFLEAA